MKKSVVFGIACLLAASVAQADWVTTTVPAGNGPNAVAVNPATNKIYVTNVGSSNLTVIDGATNATTLVAAGSYPWAVAVNPVTNKIYVASNGSGKVTVIDGATNDTTTVPVNEYAQAVAVNPVTNKVYVAGSGPVSNVTVIDGATNDTTTVPAGSVPCAVAVNPVSNKIYVPNHYSHNVTVIDGATNDTTLVPTDSYPYGVAVNPVTNKIYVTNGGSSKVTVIDGATNDTTTVAAGIGPSAVAVNPVTNKIYVANRGSANVTVIDGATNGTTLVPTDSYPYAVAVNPVTNKIYVANSSPVFNNVTVIADVPTRDTKVRAEFDHLPGDTTSFGRPTLTGKGVNRSSPSRTAMIGVGSRMNTDQTAWDWATVTSGAGTDSIMWTYNWGTDSLIAGENFVCCVPLEDQAATTNNLGLGSPFAGNLEVYAVYRIGLAAGVEGSPKPQATSSKLGPTVVRGLLVLCEVGSGQNTAYGTELLDISGRQVLNLKSGANDVSRLSPGVYFVREAQVQAVRKVVVAR